MSPSPHAARSPLGHALRAVASGAGLALFTASIAASMGNTGCGTIAIPKGPGEPCTRSSECRAELSCASGVCAVASDAGPEDASVGDDAAR